MLQRVKKGYDQVWGDLHLIRRREWDVIERWLKPDKKDVVLDLACGDGYFSEKLGKKVEKVVGIDIDETAIEKASKRAGEFEQGDALRLRWETGTFDKSISVCALQHMKDDIQVLKEVYRVLKPGGKAVISVDSISSFGKDDFLKQHAKREEVVHLYTAKSLREKMEHAGFTVEKEKYVLNSKIAYRIVRAWSRRKFTARFSLLFPVLHPLIALADVISTKDRGCALIMQGGKHA